MNGSMVLSGSPPQSGMFIHGTLKGSLKSRRHSDRSVSLSPPFMSPIQLDNENGMLCKKFKRSCSITRLDLVTEMSIDHIDADEIQNQRYDYLLDISRNTNTEATEDNREIIVVNNETNLCGGSADVETSKYTHPISAIVQFKPVVLNNQIHNATSLTSATEIEKSCTHKSYKQSNTMFGTSDPSSILNSVQDTGYQTYSMNSIMHTVDGYNISMQNPKVQSKEQTVTSNHDAQLSWKEDMPNVFSSTPSKCNKEKNS
ncbi:hypothetical protein EAI_01606 [Harpegnathos saltator]|uniref:Uncharacterized protein n=2 Tax=Harpegnathos saltator TaxID=610380 RepID=E2C9Z5_HARSA|nr:hypothetical protein EAI_01606 [Harpegnathos saltator]